MKVYSYVLGTVKDAPAAEEITQNAFAKAAFSGKKFEGRSGVYTWLCAIAKNLCTDWFREESRKDGGSGDFDRLQAEGSAEEDFVKRETSFEIHRVLHELPEPYREVFELRVFGELSFREIGAIFAKTESWARVTYHRARLKIRERMEKNESGSGM